MRIVGLEAVPLPEVPQAIAELARAQAELWVRLHAHHAVTLTETPTTNLKLHVEQAAELVGRSVSWMRKHGQALPGYHKDEKTRRVYWLERPLRTWTVKGGPVEAAA
jgi:hypothetical protein